MKKIPTIFQRNPDKLREILEDRTFAGIRQWLTDKGIEGLVFHHPDGRMAKIKKRAFGLSR